MDISKHVTAFGLAIEQTRVYYAFTHEMNNTEPWYIGFTNTNKIVVQYLSYFCMKPFQKIQIANIVWKLKKH